MADKDARAARLKAQLRANLKRRKAPGMVADPSTTPNEASAITDFAAGHAAIDGGPID